MLLLLCDATVLHKESVLRHRGYNCNPVRRVCCFAAFSFTEQSAATGHAVRASFGLQIFVSEHTN
jgi:hypothetical protein